MKSYLVIPFILFSGFSAHAALFKNLNADQVWVESTRDFCNHESTITHVYVSLKGEKTPVFSDCLKLKVVVELLNTLNALRADTSLRLEIDTTRLYNFTHSLDNPRELPRQIPGFEIPDHVSSRETSNLLKRIEALEKRVGSIEKK